MQMPSIDRSVNLRPAGADLLSSGGSKVVPVPPVNPSVNASAVVTLSAEGQANALKAAERVHVSEIDPVQVGADAATGNRDWTVAKPEVLEPTKNEAPPKEPISRMLIEHITSLWLASAKAVELSLTQNQNAQQGSSTNAAASAAARETLTYSPTKISKTGNTDNI